MSCPDCFKGYTHAGSPKGQITKLHGLDVYMAEPPEGTPVRGIIVIIPDAFGWEFVNNRILADHYAEKGRYRVYLPDFMDGHSLPLWIMDTMLNLTKSDNTLYDWVMKPYHILCTLYAAIPWFISNRFSITMPKVISFFTSLRQTDPSSALPIGAAGFCWGGKHTINLAHGITCDIITSPDGNRKRIPLIDVGFTGHPSLLDIPGEIEKIKLPVSFALGELDRALKMPRIEQIRGIIENKPEGEGRGEVKIYYGASHGFCVRADLVLRDGERQAVEAEEQALHWFNRHFAAVSI